MDKIKNWSDNFVFNVEEYKCEYSSNGITLHTNFGESDKYVINELI